MKGHVERDWPLVLLGGMLMVCKPRQAECTDNHSISALAPVSLYLTHEQIDTGKLILEQLPKRQGSVRVGLLIECQ